MKTNSLKAWLLAARPKTLSGAAVPVMIGLALAYTDAKQYDGEVFSWCAALLCLFFSFAMQIDANFIIAITTCIACLIGLPLVLYGGLEMILIGFLCVVFAFLYTTFFSYMGLGDILVLVFFGLIPVSCTYYVQLHAVTSQVLLASLACGLVIDALLLINNFRDRDNDRLAGKNTIIVRLGAEAGLQLYLGVGIGAIILGGVFWMNGHILAFFLPLIYLILHVLTYVKMKRIYQGKALNLILGDAARNIFIYGLLVSLGILLV